MKRASAFCLIAVVVLCAAPRHALAHCDSMDGPVVRSARLALATADANPALIWVKPEYEQAIRDAFAKTLAVRKLGKDAQEMADLYFFETLVRLHRAGEGEPFTGLKPAGYYQGIYQAADQALEGETIGTLDELPRLTAQKLTELHKEARTALKYAPADVPAGRAFVAKYTAYMHFIERLHEMLGEEATHTASK